jgi:large-conductance mechanosensitive channel
MKALIAFVILGLIVLTLIEVNERIKAKKSKDCPQNKAEQKDCPQNKPEQEDCTGCGLAEVCEKEEKKTSR